MSESILVASVKSVDARWLAMNKVSIEINASGTVPTNDWKNPKLNPVVYVVEPSDGIWEFSFVADGPGGHLDIITEVKASYKWENPPVNIKGVRVASATNKIEATIGNF